MEGETNFGLREDMVKGDHRLGRELVIEPGGQLWPRRGIVNGQLGWDCGNRDARCSLLLMVFILIPLYHAVARPPSRKVPGWLEQGLLAPLRDRSEVVAAPESFLLTKPQNSFGKMGLLLPAHRPSRKEGPVFCGAPLGPPGQGCSSLGASQCRAFQCSLDPRRLHLVCPALWWWNGLSLPVAQNSSFLGHQHICHCRWAHGW